jgi:hypothetical protein
MLGHNRLSGVACRWLITIRVVSDIKGGVVRSAIHCWRTSEHESVSGTATCRGVRSMEQASSG